MPRAPNAKVSKAKDMFQQGYKLIDIAKQLEVPEGSVRRWKSTYKWDSERSDTDDKPKASVRKKGPPKGNKNAKGHGAPKGNKNNLQHGVYAKLIFSDLTEEELELLGIISPLKEQELLKNEYLSLTIREKRLQEEIVIEKGKTKGLNIKDVTTRNLTINGKQEKETTTHVSSTFERIVRLEALLTGVQAKKIACIDKLHKIGAGADKLTFEKGKFDFKKYKDEAELQIKKEVHEKVMGADNKQPIKIEFIKASERSDKA